MTEVYWRTTQAAAELGISPHHMRKICEANLIEAEKTPAGQWRVPGQEVNRLKKDGVPPIPVTAEPQPKARSSIQNGRTELLAPPTDVAAAAVEEVVISDAELKVRRNKLEKLKLKQEATQVGDFFRERRRRETEQEEARRRQEREVEEERQRQIQQQLAAQERHAWRDQLIRYAQNSRPYDAPETLDLDIVEQVERVLRGLDPSRDYSIVRGQVDAAIESALAPWKAEKHKQEAIEYALRYESAFDDPHRNRRARDAAEEAIARMPQSASLEDMKAVASESVQPLKQEYEHARKCRDMAARAWLKLQGETNDEREESKDAVQVALEALPLNASDRQFEQTCDLALEPIQAKIAERERQGQRKEAATVARRQAEQRADWKLLDIGNYISELEQDEEIEFDGFSDRWGFTENVKNRIRGELVGALVKNPKLSDDEVQDLIEILVDRHKDEFLE